MPNFAAPTRATRLPRWLSSPSLWLPLALLLLAWQGSRLLAEQRFVALDPRDRSSYGFRPLWQARFDALSATCGAGLLLHDLKEDYAPAGRWVLAGLGLAGAVLYLVAARQALGRVWTPAPANEHEQIADSTSTPPVTSNQAPPFALPSFRRILLAFLIVQTAVLPLPWLVAWLTDRAQAPAFPDAAWSAIAAFSSLGWTHPQVSGTAQTVCAALALLSALGWAVWLLPVGFGAAPRKMQDAGAAGAGAEIDAPPPPSRTRGTTRAGRRLTLAILSYLAGIALCATLIATLEVPRAKRTEAGRPITATTTSDRLADQAVPARVGRSFVLVAAAAGAGLPTEPIGNRGVSEGTKLLLALTLLIGGLGGSPGGGIKWLLLLWGLAGLCGAVGCGPRGGDHPVARRCLLAALACTGALLTLTLVVALGLLIIDAQIGSSFQTPPTVADALLEASCATAGGNLSTGLTARLTSASLSRGIRQAVDSYQYGLLWLAGAMFIGRVLPIVVLGRVAAARFRSRPARLPPLP